MLITGRRWLPECARNVGRQAAALVRAHINKEGRLLSIEGAVALGPTERPFWAGNTNFYALWPKQGLQRAPPHPRSLPAAESVGRGKIIRSQSQLHPPLIRLIFLYVSLKIINYFLFLAKSCLVSLSSIRFICPDVFIDEDPLSKEVIDLDNRIKSLGWSKEKYFFTVCTWMSKDEYLQAMMADFPITKVDTPGDEALLDCTCKHDIGCFAFGGTCNDDISCKEKRACGLLGNSLCDGQCE